MMMTATLLERLEAAWVRSDRIFDMLHASAWSERPIPLRHPFVFYLGHLPAFAWNQVCRGVLQRDGFLPVFDDIFERGIDPPDTFGPTEQVPMRWPERAAIEDYRDRVREELREAYPLMVEHAGEDIMARGARVYSAVLEHELMHHETLLYMLQELETEHKQRPDELPPMSFERGVARRPMRVPHGPARMGARFEALPFGWDNEFPQHVIEVPAFSIDATPVTNGEFFMFVESGGYEEAALWTADGWRWKREHAIGHPHGWCRRDGEWFVRTLFEEVPLRRVFDWPVAVSWVEAEAFARREGRRLPTEAEYHRAAYASPDDELRSWPWGEASPSERHGNFDFHHWAPTPVGSHPDGASAFGVHDLMGNGWEWTSSLFAPYPGFTAYMPNYPGYSTDFFDERHYVMLGGSWATDRDLLRRSFRNWFQPHYPYVFGKFRCVSAG